MGNKVLCWASEGTNPTAVAMSPQLGPFVTASGTVQERAASLVTAKAPTWDTARTSLQHLLSGKAPARHAG